MVIFDNPPITLGKAGSLQGWQDAVARFAVGQDLYTSCVAFGFVGPVLHFSPHPDNIGVELCGDSSTGKSTGLDLCSSIWGAPHDRAGSIAVNWRISNNGLEQPMLARASAVLPIDEANQIGFGDPAAGSKLGGAIFMLAGGTGRLRYDSPISPRAQLAFLSTSNVPLADLLNGVNREQADAVRVRMTTIPADAGTGLGAFNTVPEGYASPKAAVLALRAALAANHGHAIKPFLCALLADAERNEVALRAKVKRHTDVFLRAVEVDGDDAQQQRRAQAFSNVYAAAKLAAEYGVLPIKRLKVPLVEVYRRSLAAHTTSERVPGSAIERLTAYVSRYGVQLIDLDAVKPVAMTVAEMSAQPGFLKTIRGCRCLLVRSAQWRRAFGARARTMLTELRGQGRLHATNGLQIQARVRSNRDKDRVYAVAITDASSTPLSA